MEEINEEVYSSPLANRDNGISGFTLKTVKASNSIKLTHISDPDGLIYWLNLKNDSWLHNRNAFFYYYSKDQKLGPWSEEEKNSFINAINTKVPSDQEWGIFSTQFPGRNGKQCRRLYNQLLKDGQLPSQLSPASALNRKLHDYSTIPPPLFELEPPFIDLPHKPDL